MRRCKRRDDAYTALVKCGSAAGPSEHASNTKGRGDGRMLWIALALIGSLLSSCSVEGLDLEGRECPCVAGWVCEPATQLCVPAGRVGPIDSAIRSETDAGLLQLDGNQRFLDASGAVSEGGANEDSSSIRPDGSPDGATMADAAVSPASRCDEPEFSSRLFCDGFEKAGLTGWDGTSSASGAQVERVSDLVYRGNGALRAESPTGASGAVAFKQVFPDAPELSDYWYRAYYFIPASSGLGIFFHEIAELEYQYGAVVYVELNYLEVYSGGGWNGDRLMGIERELPRDRWFCLETHIHVGVRGAFESFLDGEPLVALRGVDTRASLGFDMIGAGISFKEVDSTAAVLYVDEVVADSEQIGCD